MTTLTIVLGMDEKVGRKEIWEKTDPCGRLHQEAGGKRRELQVLFAKSS